MKHLLSAYLKEIAQTTIQGDAREESYYASLATLFTDFPLEKGRKTKVTTLPKKTDVGNPDFRIWDGDHFIVGYIEAKTPGTNLDQVETTDQLDRYLGTFPNLILTDFYEFRLYRNGQEVDRATIARQFTARKLKTTPQLENIEAFVKLANQFFGFKLPKSFTSESLAVELAKRTRFLRDQVVTEELNEAEQGKGDIFGYYQAFQKYLIPNLTPEQFADLYSQTITYGLFAARTRANGDFNRGMAFEYIPNTIGILRDLFRFISLGTPSRQMEVIVDDIASVLNAADINSILDQYYKQGKGEDPIVHFYETFLNQYDPQTRERRGVYYTPEPVVKYIVKSVHHLLKTRFNLRDGLADPSVTALDPAAGTLTFPAEAIKLAVKEYVDKYGEGGKKEFIRKQILKNYYALELMMAPYAIGHMKISFLLESLGYKLQGDDSFKFYLTNTLEMEDIAQIDIPGISSLSVESHLAGKVKKDPILVIMGNPPYSGSSANKNDWTEKLLKEDLDGARSYYKVDGKPLGERNPKMLQDDYVKFLRFAQWKIQKAGNGIVAMITNHAYLDNPTFRGMRQSLMKTFDEMYILDLHGNSLKRETAPDGGKDENVFDIRVGVAIALFVKHGVTSEGPALIYHSGIFGTRESKYDYLNINYFETTNWKEIQPSSKFLIFLPRDNSGEKAYYKFPSVIDIFRLYSTGIKTHRDGFAFDFDKDELLRRISQFRDLSIPDDIIRQSYSLNDTRDWKLSVNRKELNELMNWQKHAHSCHYRPFDERALYYHHNVVELPRFEVMRNMLEDNIGLSIVRQVKAFRTWQHCLITNEITECCNISNKTSETSYIFPLYIYPDTEKLSLFDHLQNEKEENLSSSILSEIEKKYLLKPLPNEIIDYIYGILYSNIFRKEYFEYLKGDFPRIPFTTNYDVFKLIADLGQRLVDLHLFKSLELDQTTVKYQGQGDDHTITKPSYVESEKRVYINPTHYFEGVEPEVWQYQIGGYQVMNKYLKDRKGRRMDDPRHYIHIATGLEKTIQIQEEIDTLYPDVEKNVIEFSENH